MERGLYIRFSVLSEMPFANGRHRHVLEFLPRCPRERAGEWYRVQEGRSIENIRCARRK